MFQASTAGKQIEGDIKNVIGFGVRRVILENRNRLIDVFPQFRLFDQALSQTDTATRDGLLFFRELVFDFLANNV